jgi:multiple sugar transport system substrate-binding protein
MMRKLSLILVLVALLTGVGLTGAQDVVTLEFWGGWTGPDGAIMQQLVDKYNAENPGVQVTLTVQAWSPLFDAFIAAASAGESPDIMAMHPQETAMFINLGLIEPLDEIIAESEVFQQDAYVQKAWDLQFYDGQMWAYPYDLGIHGMYFNADLFEAAGVEPPTNAEEFLEVARVLTVDASGNHPGDEGFDPANIVQYAINMQTNHHGYYQWYSLYNQLGGQLISDDGMSCAMDIDKATQAWQWLQDLVYVHYAAPQGQTDYTRDFLSGRTAMLIDGPWQIPAMIAAEAESGFNWGTAAYPTIFDQPAVWGSGHNFTLPTLADPEKRDEAIAFIEWLAMNSFDWMASGQLPIRNDLIASEEFQALPGRASFVEMLPNQALLPNIPKFSEVFASNAPTPTMVMGQRILLEQADVRSTVEAACNEITAILSIP